MKPKPRVVRSELEPRLAVRSESEWELEIETTFTATSGFQWVTVTTQAEEAETPEDGRPGWQKVPKRLWNKTGSLSSELWCQENLRMCLMSPLESGALKQFPCIFTKCGFLSQHYENLAYFCCKVLNKGVECFGILALEPILPILPFMPACDRHLHT